MFSGYMEEGERERESQEGDMKGRRKENGEERR